MTPHGPECPACYPPERLFREARLELEARGEVPRSSSSEPHRLYSSELSAIRREAFLVGLVCGCLSGFVAGVLLGAVLLP